MKNAEEITDILTETKPVGEFYTESRNLPDSVKI